nr:immunoglobulin heavy chain junction region [Macaca mulatta]MOW84442.1 immunoglobulin heavy chain junction region [Macaca mulatta]
CARDHSGYDCW